MKKNQLYPTDLTDRQWNCIKELIPPAKPGGRPRTLEMRGVINAILYLVVTGCQWRMLPREYPAWQSVYTYFREWSDDGTWQRIHDTLRTQVRQRAGRHKHPTAGALDSQSVKTTQIPGVRGYDAGKKVNGRKRHILVETLIGADFRKKGGEKARHRPNVRKYMQTEVHMYSQEERCQAKAIIATPCQRCKRWISTM
jgi:putative transposase